MKNKIILSAMLLLLSPTILMARTDYQCLNDCTERGSQYSFCKEKCSFGDRESSSSQYDDAMSIFNKPKFDGPKMDRSCYNRCLRVGNMDNQCYERCME